MRPSAPQPKSQPPTLSTPQSIVTIAAGKNEAQQTYNVHKSIICHCSPFFHAAFNSNFVEGQTQSMNLEDVDRRVFSLLVHWLYTQQIEKTGDIEGDEIYESDDLLLMAKLSTVAERFLIPVLQKQAGKLVYLLMQSKGFCGEEFWGFTNFAYENKLDTPLKEMVADWMAFATPEKLRNSASLMPDEMLLDVAVALCRDHADLMKGFNARFGNVENYYPHV